MSAPYRAHVLLPGLPSLARGRLRAAVPALLGAAFCIALVVRSVVRHRQLLELVRSGERQPQDLPGAGEIVGALGIWAAVWLFLAWVSSARDRAADPERDRRAGVSLWEDAFRRLRKNGAATVSSWLLIAVVLLCVFAPWLTPYTYDEQQGDAALQGPSRAHPMGTDFHGRDILTRVLYGGRLSLAVGAVASLVSLGIGVAYGSISGYAGGRADEFMMRFVEVLYALPYMFLVILLVAVFGRNLLILFIALGAVQWLTIARIVRGQMLSLREKEFVEGARAQGAGSLRIVSLHLIPNLLGPVIVYTTLTVPAVMLQEAFLSFLGLGVQPPHASWGLLAAEGSRYINILETNWWLILFPGGMLTVTLFCLNFLGDGLRDALDPRAKNA